MLKCRSFSQTTLFLETEPLFQNYQLLQGDDKISFTARSNCGVLPRSRYPDHPSDKCKFNQCYCLKDMAEKALSIEAMAKILQNVTNIIHIEVRWQFRLSWVGELKEKKGKRDGLVTRGYLWLYCHFL